MKLLKLTVLPIILMFSVSASATIIDFKHMGNGFLGYGESAWAPLNLDADFGVDIDIEGYTSSGLAWAYLDTGEAGLGVCGAIQADKVNLVNQKRGGGQNLCDPPSDDNVSTTASEYLKLTFNESATIGNLWFNNNHDVD
ncbi:MAG: hypothetical protein HKN08_01900, partial [Gammaproteobacteria bacterium]|nr:hypothetical protein [Gammaproteobacteria bacterium]